eukprot:12908819-Prorocentrum_lima.AAC.1
MPGPHTALPMSMDDAPATVQGVHTYQHISVDVAKKILLALLENAELPPWMPLLIVDLHTGVGN